MPIQPLDLASQVNYSPNDNAQILAMHKSHTLGLLFTSIANGTSQSISSAIIKSVKQASSEQYNPFLLTIAYLNTYDFGTLTSYSAVAIWHSLLPYQSRLHFLIEMCQQYMQEL
ncbi:LacI family DNA-binding transcriptional regulator [Bacillus mojavensis]|nr:LacI family DNA-binding transcriptional regulator [Bacillus mojavensis]